MPDHQFSGEEATSRSKKNTDEIIIIKDVWPQDKKYDELRQRPRQLSLAISNYVAINIRQNFENRSTRTVTKAWIEINQENLAGNQILDRFYKMIFPTDYFHRNMQMIWRKPLFGYTFLAKTVLSYVV
jgi:post-segregation antitoxin (ccd killing protein)